MTDPMTTPPLDLPALRRDIVSAARCEPGDEVHPWEEVDPDHLIELLDRVTAAESSLARYIVERTRFGDAMAANAVAPVVDAIMRELTEDADKRAREANARAEAAEKKVAAVREALEAHPKACDRHTEDDPIKCGWKRAVADVTRALDSTPYRTLSTEPLVSGHHTPETETP